MISLDVPYKSISHFYFLKLYLKHHILQLYFSNAHAIHGGFDPGKISGVGTNFGLLFHVLPGPNNGHT
jgi:hypothetical protein